MRVAVISSGFSHVRRGIEAWAADLTEGLNERWLGGSEHKATLFCGSLPPSASTVNIVSLPCLKRGSPANRILTTMLSPFGGWRFGFGSEYQTEQTTMAPFVSARLAADGCNIAHTQDPWLAFLLQRAFSKRRHKAAVILAHGTEEAMKFLEKFDFLQELSPPYAARHGRRKVFMIPNFVNTALFRPASSVDERKALRKKWGLETDCFIVGSVGAVKYSHKRMDLLLREFSVLQSAMPQSLLLIAGARTNESGRIEEMGRHMADKIRIFYDLPRERMPEFYALLDVFALFSERELFGIAFLEAMASGVPCVAQDEEVTRWIVGESGIGVNANQVGAAADVFLSLVRDPLRRRAMGEKGRQRSLEVFSREKVVAQIIEMYARVLTRCVT